jgi:hypothetical protein
MMPKMWLAALIVIAACGLPRPGLTATPEQSAEVAAVLAQYPNGGPGLAAAVARAVEADPVLAALFVSAASTASQAVAQAIGTGLGTAASFFAQLGTVWAKTALGVIVSAVASAPADVSTAFAAASGPTLTTSSALDPANDPPVGTSRCVSASQGHGRCVH